MGTETKKPKVIKGRVDVLNRAKTVANDEFYTLYEDVEAELSHYEGHFKGKSVLCPCDNPYESSFSRYFLRNFRRLGLDRLVCISYSPSPVTGDIDSPVHAERAYVLDLRAPLDGVDADSSDDDVRRVLSASGLVRPLYGDGDFRSGECSKYFASADIVVTNPPFSLMRQFVCQLEDYRKKYLIVGPVLAMSTSALLPMFIAGRVWFGVGFRLNGFRVPDFRSYADSNVRIGFTCWITNLDHGVPVHELALTSEYTGNESYYPKYDNLDAIEVSELPCIPCDYYGLMGVPITYLVFHDPSKFELLGNPASSMIPGGKVDDLFIDGRRCFRRLIIRRIPQSP